MKRRMTKVTAMVAVLLLGLFAAPAAAQDAGDTIEVDVEVEVEVEGEAIEGVTALQCSVGVAQANADGNLAVFGVVFADFFPDFDDATLDVGEVETGEEQALVDATVAFLDAQGQTLADVCSIYIVDVLPTVEERVEDEEVIRVTEEVEEEIEPEVLGVSLQRTGVDAVLMAILGATMLVLGAVAVRRTREDEASA